MPWKETSVVDGRLQFIAACKREEHSVSALCRTFGISRKTGYKWLARYDDGGARCPRPRTPARNDPAG